MLFDSGPELIPPITPVYFNISKKISLLSLYPYGSDSVSLMSSIKNMHRTYYYRQLAKFLACQCIPLLPLSPSAVMTYVPSSRNRVKKRGFEHSKVLAKLAGSALRLPVFSLLKSKKTRLSQVGLSPSERKSNIQGAFLSTQKLENDIFLVDDLVTTGSTILESSSVLLTSGASSITILTLAAHPSFIKEFHEAPA